MSRSGFAALAAIAVCFSISSLDVFSDDAPKKSAPARKVPAAVAEAKSIEGVVVRASSIVGMPVKNPEDKDLGKVEDVVIDMETGSVRYVAISFGGFLRVGDKLFAVPFRTLRVQHEPASKKAHFVLDIDKTTLEKARGFDKKDWPNFADPRFAEENDRFFVEVKVRKLKSE
jgi:sporulation protein YlmC with PRC-barrel domain